MSEEVLMKSPRKALYDQVKGFLKRIPVVQRLLELKSEIINTINQIRELSSLLEEDKYVIFPSYSRMGNDVALTREMVHEVVKEWLDLYGIIYLGRKTAAAFGFPAKPILLYTPQALLKIPSTYEEYMQQVEPKTRRKNRLADKQGYEFKEFPWNDYLDDIYAINTSKDMRQSEPMRGWYREPVKPRNHSEEELQYRKYYGAFKEGKLYAYFHIWICGDIAVAKHVIGHAEHLKYGIMNGLISYAVRECIGNPQILWLHYGRYQTGSLSAFKKHAGFQGYATLLDLEGDKELLKYSKRTVKTWWRV